MLLVSSPPSCQVITVTSTACFSLGEAMRSLDQRDIIKGTFILVTGEEGGEEGAGCGRR